MTSLLKRSEWAFAGPNTWMRRCAKSAHVAALFRPPGHDPPRKP